MSKKHQKRQSRKNHPLMIASKAANTAALAAMLGLGHEQTRRLLRAPITTNLNKYAEAVGYQLKQIAPMLFAFVPIAANPDAMLERIATIKTAIEAVEAELLNTNTCENEKES